MTELKRGQRRKLPDRRYGPTFKARIGDASDKGKQHVVYLRCGEYPEDHSLAEIFLDCHRMGSTLRAFMNLFAIVFSLALQYGCPLEKLVNSLKGTHFEPNGDVTGSAEVERCFSMVDYVVKQLEAIYLRGKDAEQRVPGDRVDDACKDKGIEDHGADMA